MNVPAGQALLLHIVPLAVWVLTHPTEKRTVGAFNLTFSLPGV